VNTFAKLEIGPKVDLVGLKGSDRKGGDSMFDCGDQKLRSYQRGKKKRD